jgi:SAM-dependent methyltransferase
MFSQSKETQRFTKRLRVKSKKVFLKETYFPNHTLNRMQSEGDVSTARDDFLSKRFNNLDYLLKNRYEWMNNHIENKWKVIEIGAGAGLSELYLQEKVFMTDVVKNSWIDGPLDATNMQLQDQSVDCIIASHNIHHFYSPYKFFKECERVIKPGGCLLIQELNTSLALRVLLRLMRHEGWSYDVDVFDEEAVANDPSDLWSANCAIPELLFEQEKKFEAVFSTLKIELNKKGEFLIFPLSGGVISKTKVPELPTFLLSIANKIDQVLCYMLPNVFAMGRSVVIRKKG